MRKVRLTILVVGALALAVGIVFFLVSYLRPKVAGIYIETVPEAAVIIDGVDVGRTPFKATRDPGEVVVRLVPDSFEVPLAPYETRLNLVSGVETVIKWNFGPADEYSSGEVVSFEKISAETASLVIVSIPDLTQLSINGQSATTTPYKVSAIAPSEHTLRLSAEGYDTREIRVRTHAGYQLTAVVQLSKKEDVANEEIFEEGEGAVEEIRPEAEILSTSTGFLRVREDPSTLAAEVGRVRPGEKYLVLEEDERNGWYRIEYEEGSTGWISGQYARVVNESAVSPTPSDIQSEP